ncbi:tyrosine-protein kinase, CSF-1/PDGF receptor family [Artemisia annua]|uniref:Tyrosine-protein kinase, CSF-1/PDGF receptor family n=1 Tax=Artemisia annua TaxID=35608 RepID=A0A2U1KMQ2_ARTAN|nr:tyrosine-protein kinase, CSF-1/PDGF receptor family [Artemisia annua]
MASFLTELKHLEIKLEDIKSATNNFDEKNVIGHGGFGKVYEGKLAFPHSEGEILVALKRLDRKYGQGDPEFYKEIRFLSCYRHENLISLLGFCNQGGEMILVYEHASGGSLDRILNSTALTWPQRLKICLDAAKGISFLHDPNGAHQRVLHCDIKILFEVLCGRLCAEFSNGQLNIFVPMWKKSYKEKKLDDIIFKDLKQQMDQKSLETFADIAFQCLQKHREQRPPMSLVVQKLKIALQFQDPVSFNFSDSLEIINAADTSLTYKGLLVTGGKTAARETGPLQASKNKLEKQVEDLTWRLQLEKRLRALAGSLEQKIGETEKRYEETNKLSEERLKQALDAETKIIQLKTAMQSNGEYVKAGDVVWSCKRRGSAWEELKHIRQALGFLKYRISYDDITNDLCPVLSVDQLYRICTLYWDDNYNTKSVSPEVISSMRVLMTEDANTAVSSSFLLDDNSRICTLYWDDNYNTKSVSPEVISSMRVLMTEDANTAVSSSFLLDDNSSIPFSVDDLSTSLQVKDFADVKPAVELAENPAFLFLL